VFPVVSEQVAGDGELVQRQLAERIRFSKLGLWDQVFHTVASPPVAYLLLLAGLLLMLLDFYTGGVGVAGVVGMVCFLLSCYGLDVLGARWWAVAMLVAAVAAFAIDVQAGVPRFWTAVGAALLTVGTFTLYSNFTVWWLAAGAGIVLTLLFVISGLPSLIRTRYSTTTIGREWMIGDLGTAVSDIDPDGVVEVQGGRWRARTNRHTPITSGAAARVVSIEGILLEVEPEEGGAVDHRERRRSRRDGEDGAATGG
jgi:membrane-bound serine protease (ClpP class)